MYSKITRTARSAGRLVHDRRGAAASELALIAPLLLLIIFGTFQYATLFYTYNAMVKSARDVARQLALVDAVQVQAEAQALANRPTWVPAGNWVVSSTNGLPDVTAQITVPANKATFLPVWVPMPTTLTASAVMRKEV